MTRILILAALILAAGTTAAIAAGPYPPESREVKIIDRAPDGAKTLVTVLVGKDDRLYMTRHEVAVIHPDGSETETVLQDPRNLSLSRSK